MRVFLKKMLVFSPKASSLSGSFEMLAVIGPDGKVQKRWDKVKVDGHADEVLAAL